MSAPTLLGSVASGGNAAAAATNTLTVSHTLTSGNNRRVFICVGWDDSGSTATGGSTVTYGGNSCTQVTDGTTTAEVTAIATNQNGCEVWSILEASLPADGAQDAIVTLDQTVDVIYMMVFAVQDADQTSNVDKVAVNADTDGDANISATITPSQECFVFDYVSASHNGTDPAVQGADQTLMLTAGVASLAGDGAHFGSYESGTGTRTMSWTMDDVAAREGQCMVAIAYQSPWTPETDADETLRVNQSGRTW